MKILFCAAETANKITQSPCCPNSEPMLKGAVVSFFYHGHQYFGETWRPIAYQEPAILWSESRATWGRRGWNSRSNRSKAKKQQLATSGVVKVLVSFYRSREDNLLWKGTEVGLRLSLQSNPAWQPSRNI